MMFQTWEVQADSARGQRLAAAARELTGYRALAVT